MSKSTAVEPFTPPPPQEGCNCGVCKPFIQNAKYQAAYEAQSASPFVRYKIMKEDENGNTRELTEDELQELERTHPELCEWNKPAQSLDMYWKRECKRILDQLHDKDKNNNRRKNITLPDGVFQKPVDTVREAPDYHKYVVHPMDLGTIRNALDCGDIVSPDDFITLVRLTFRNAMLYNPQHAPIHKLAQECSKLFEQWVEQQRGRYA